MLEEETRTTSELCKFFQLSRFAVMQHLKMLEKAGLLRVERHGRYRYNHLDKERLAELRQQAASETGVQDVMESGLRVERAHIQETFMYPATPAELFAALTLHIGDWWKNDGASVLLEPQLGGRLWKQFDTDGNGVLFGIIDIFRRDELLGFMGSMGVDTAVSLIRFRLSAVDTLQTTLTLDHRFVGEIDIVTWEAFQHSWHELLGIYLRLFLEGLPRS